MSTVEQRLARVEAQLTPLQEEPPDLRHVVTSEEAMAQVEGLEHLPILIEGFMMPVHDENRSLAARAVHAMLNHEANSPGWIAARDELDRIARGDTKGVSPRLAADEVTRARQLWCLLARYYLNPVLHLPPDPWSRSGTGQSRTNQDTPTSR
ncbi:hypothetical protein [Aquihabitans sp. McL0605]|uniref:hypothetical protein n=1 Tax=Aquihabitans sp. McL0605 TaxID=3415671 RepID=UPI003CEB77AC